MHQFLSPREELLSSLEKIQQQLTQARSDTSSLNKQVAIDISDAIHLSREQQSKAKDNFNQFLTQKEQQRSS
ncbi:MAG: hypothetical protein PUP92_32550 [Rhizonema sp. PD38]|nr:hypothetical protein [Rhizonema sp. PD38]